ncbi:MAG: hypothetical protein IT286_04415 [Proteobacteria bacterium]|nr:hypothetical protein [Pseudomonadota bacterium]
MNFMNWKLPVIISTAVIGLYACTQVDVNGLNPSKFTNSGKGGGGTNAVCDDVNSTFSSDVLPVFLDKCAGSGCHTGTGAGGGLNLDADDDTRGDGASGVIGNIKGEGTINAFSAAQSTLLLKPLAASEGGQSGSHTGGQVFANTADPDYKKIFCWIDAGAKNDLTDTQCGFGEHVYPIFRQRGCTAGTCHDASAPAGNMNLSQGSIVLLTDNPNGTATFADALIQPVFTAGDANSLLLTKPAQLNGVTHGGGEVFDGTTDTDYQTVKCWIDEGAQNN